MTEKANPIAFTERLSLRPLSSGDIPRLAAMLADPEVMRFSERGVMTAKATAEFVEWCEQLYSTRGFGPWALITKERAEFVGFSGLTPKEYRGASEVEVGYRLCREAWGKGYATEAAAAALQIGFTQLGCQRILCSVLSTHAASIHVAEKIGFTRYEREEWRGQELRIYEISLDEWRCRIG